jgi:tetratricopeptide (TPR) repeat protein
VVLCAGLVLGIAASLAPFTVVERYRLSAWAGLLPLAAAGALSLSASPRLRRAAAAGALTLALSVDPWRSRLLLPDMLASGPALSWTEAQAPRQASEASNLAAAFLRAGDRGRAAAFLAQALALDPSRDDDRATLGGLLLGGDDAQAGIQHLQAVLAHNPRHGGALSALCAHRLGRGEAEALALCAAAAGARPEAWEAWYQLAIAAAEAGRFDEAISAMRRALALNPGLPRGQDLLQRLERAGEAP